MKKDENLLFLLLLFAVAACVGSLGLLINRVVEVIAR